MKKELRYTPRNLEVIYFAGGCYWGVDAFYSRMPGVVETETGFADSSSLPSVSETGWIPASAGMTKKEKGPSYEEVCKTGYPWIETVKVVFDPDVIARQTLVERFGKIVDFDKLGEVQGPDIGYQYTTGYWDEITFYPADNSHQEYLSKNPTGYCHINIATINTNWALVDKNVYSKPLDEELKAHLTDEQYRVTQLADTEMPFSGEYETNWSKGIYVDVVTGEPLFLSTEKFDSGCGWPAFSKPIDDVTILELTDTSIFHRSRTEVKSASGQSHLGHVFTDGPAPETGERVKDLSADPETTKNFDAPIQHLPKTPTGLRYCINSASLRFVPIQSMEQLGYGWLIGFLPAQE
jgi:peptide methionine sulfoxide reductase msrA/msrB